MNRAVAKAGDLRDAIHDVREEAGVGGRLAHDKRRSRIGGNGCRAVLLRAGGETAEDEDRAGEGAAEALGYTESSHAILSFWFGRQAPEVVVFCGHSFMAFVLYNRKS